ncbi:MAG: methyltransferase domain-containing protein [Acidimicrobiia bacterium]|nr:methyltransferase domain-containing protein [Acidimicrobiia bacterium]MDH3463637.1 methyltransferase domain-containing protein [Acidimicrobiia bacterium]
MTQTEQHSEMVDRFAGRVFDSVLGAMETWSIYVGDKLGLYEVVAKNDSISESELAARANMHRRYAREWLEHQVTSGILEVDDPAADPADRKYSIPAPHAEVLTMKDSLAYLAPFVRLVVAGGTQLPGLLDAYRSGGGVSWKEFGPDMRTGQAEMNRPWFMNELGSSWFPSVSPIHERLVKGGKVADVGCGEGWSSIAMALAYPNITVDGYDIDKPSIEAARQHAAAEGVADRVSFQSVDAVTVDRESGYDLVTAFECIHDMPDPVSVLRTMRSISADNGYVVVMDEAVGDAFGDRTDQVERLMYGFSMFVCLPDGMSHQPSVGTGTVMRPSVLEGYARDAGFNRIDVLPIENDLWRFYELKK